MKKMKVMDCATFILFATTFSFISGANARVTPFHAASSPMSVPDTVISDLITSIDAESAVDAVADFVEFMKAGNMADDVLNPVDLMNDQENADADSTSKLIDAEANSVDVIELPGITRACTRE